MAQNVRTLALFLVLMKTRLNSPPSPKSPLCLLQQILLCHNLPYMGFWHAFLATPWNNTISTSSTICCHFGSVAGISELVLSRNPHLCSEHTGVLINWIHLRPNCCQHQVHVDRSTKYTALSCYEVTLTMFDMWYKIIVLFQIVDSTDETSKIQYQSLRRAENMCIFMLNHFFKVHRCEFHIHMN